MPVSNLSAPFKKEAQFSRDSFIKPPDWRWQQARNIAFQLCSLSNVIASVLPVILYAARIIKACNNPKTRLFIRIKMPDTWQVITLGDMDNSSQLKASVEACIIYGLDNNQIAQRLKWITPVQAQLYIDLFCDLSGIQGISLWFLQMLLLPARQSRSMNLFRARALAHYHSLLAALHSLRHGNIGKSARLAMSTMLKDSRLRQLFDYMAKNLNIPLLVYIPAMLQAVKSRLLHLFILASKLGGNLGAGLMAAAQALDNSVRSFTLLLIVNPAVSDPSEQYIKTIINKNIQEA